MSYYGGFAPYVSVAERRRKAEKLAKKLSKAGHKLAPVSIDGRKIATSFWGLAWCDNLESYQDYYNRLERGRSYVRNGSVIDLQIAPGKVTALVSGSEVYTVGITIKEAARAHWKAICADCVGTIGSLVELLQGRISKKVMERLSCQDNGLFPGPQEIRFSCSCPDGASMCKHVAAALYGVGARLDAQPELLFRLRAVNEADLIGSIDAALDLSRPAQGAARVLDVEDMSALFGLDMADGAETVKEPAPEPVTPKRAAAADKPVKSASRNAVAKKGGAKIAPSGKAKPGKAAVKSAPANKASTNKVDSGQVTAKPKMTQAAPAIKSRARKAKPVKSVANPTGTNTKTVAAGLPAR
jgi:uncharacterized Zn finger protein